MPVSSNITPLSQINSRGRLYAPQMNTRNVCKPSSTMNAFDPQ